PSFGPFAFERLAAFLAAIPQEYRICVEVRHAGWYTPAQRERLNALLRQRHAARVVIDTRGLREGAAADALVNRSRERKPDLPVHADLTADFAFVRLVSNPQAGLNEPYFAEWAARIAGWLEAGTEVFLFSHCPDETLSPIFARALYTRVAALTRVESLPDELGQATLL
ncbi:MAG: DUF72 domain-containing protein, partial [Chloroflexi bacterium]|nr:DUF72 domain-containing protein [Chloroflexota bacterium]